MNLLSSFLLLTFTCFVELAVAQRSTLTQYKDLPEELKKEVRAKVFTDKPEKVLRKVTPEERKGIIVILPRYKFIDIPVLKSGELLTLELKDSTSIECIAVGRERLWLDGVVVRLMIGKKVVDVEIGAIVVWTDEVATAKALRMSNIRSIATSK